jgi:hypothetical protein
MAVLVSRVNSPLQRKYLNCNRTVRRIMGLVKFFAHRKKLTKIIRAERNN